MRLSDIKGDRVYEVVAGIIEPMYNIAGDKEAAELFTSGNRPDGVSKEEWAEQKVRKGLPALLRNHKDDFTTILALINGVSKKDYLESLTMTKFFSDVTSLVSDPQFRGLFPSASQSGAGKDSGSISASTKG